MSGKRNTGIAVVGGVFAAAALAIAHGFGAFADNAIIIGRDLPPPPHIPAPKVPHVPPGGVVDALDNPALAESLKQGISTFRKLRKGDDGEQVLVETACAGFSAFASEQGDRQAYEEYIWEEVPSYVPRKLVSKYVSRLADGMYAAQVNGGLARWYVQYCAFPSK